MQAAGGCRPVRRCRTPAARPTTTRMTIVEADIALDAAVRGEVVRPGDPGYDEARAVYNARHDRRPALVVRGAGVADVIAAVNHARERVLPLAVRGGGHSI